MSSPPELARSEREVGGGAAETMGGTETMTTPSAEVSVWRMFRDHPLPEPWRTTFSLLALFVILWALYFHMGLQMQAHDTLRDNMYFHSDIGRAIVDMTKFVGNHVRTEVHPLFVLFLNPIGSTLSRFVEHSSAALFINSLAGAFCAVLAGLFFRACGLSLRRSLLAMLILACSASHFYFGSAPETFMFSAISVVLLLFCVVRKPGDWRFLIPAGVFSLGILVTNFAMVVIAAGASLLPRPSWGERWRRLAAIAGGVLVVGIILSLVQHAIFPRCEYFFLRKSVTQEKSFMVKYSVFKQFAEAPNKWEAIKHFKMTGSDLAEVGDRMGSLTKYIFVYDFFAPKTYISKEDPHRAAVQIRQRSLAYLTYWGKTATGLWFAMILLGVVLSVKYSLWRRPVYVALVGCVSFNFVLHTLYGDDLLLYSCNTCFTVLAWIILCASELKGRRWLNLIDTGLAVLLVCQVANNYYFFDALVSMVYKGQTR